MKAKNITSKQFAEEIGWLPSGLSHIMSGRNKASLDFVTKVSARYPEIDIKWLMFGTGEMYDPNYGQLHGSLPVPPKVEAPSSTGMGLTTPGNTPTSTRQQTTPPSPTGELDLFSMIDAVAETTAPQLQTFVQEPLPPTSMPQPAAVAPKPDAPVQSQPITVQQPMQEQVDVPMPPVEFSSQVPASAAAPQVSENPKIETGAPIVPEIPILAKQKKIVKFIVLYDDKSFSEYYPE